MLMFTTIYLWKKYSTNEHNIKHVFIQRLNALVLTQGAQQRCTSTNIPFLDKGDVDVNVSLVNGLFVTWRHLQKRQNFISWEENEWERWDSTLLLNSGSPCNLLSGPGETASRFFFFFFLHLFCELLSIWRFLFFFWGVNILGTQ